VISTSYIISVEDRVREEVVEVAVFKERHKRDQITVSYSHTYACTYNLTHLCFIEHPSYVTMGHSKAVIEIENLFRR
jgi:hypothetical protein